jgi:7-cyano-7-deazaguanine synthase in queuosine biosynthesis
MNQLASSPMRDEACVLLLLSGGLDSTYLLHHYLTRTNLAIRAPHPIRYPEQPRWKAEGESVQRIVAYCQRECRPFHFSESSFSLDLTGDLGWDSDLQLLVASKVVSGIRAPWVTVALGWSAEDLDEPSVAERARRDVTPSLWRALRESMNDRSRVNPLLAMPLVERNIRKERMMRELPRALARMTWSCRFRVASAGPVMRPCGSCRPCRVNRLAGQRAGMVAEELPNLLGPT